MMRHDRDDVERLRAQVERVDGTVGNRRGPSGYLCCKHCKEDPIHDVAANGHDGPCSICDDPGAVLRERVEAEVERLRAEIRDRESERADLRDRVQKAIAAWDDAVTSDPCSDCSVDGVALWSYASDKAVDDAIDALRPAIEWPS